VRPFEFPDVERSELAGGLDLRIARVARLPAVSVRLFVRAGESSLGEDQAGLAVLTGDALEGGTRRRSGAQLAESLEQIGARLAVSTGWEGTSVSLSCLADRLPEGLDLLAEAVLEPGFPADEVERARSQAIAAVRQRETDPGSAASDEASRRYFRDGVPYARPLAGTRDSLGSLDEAHVRGFADAYLRPRTGGLVVVGDIDEAQIEALASGPLATWSGSPPSSDGFSVEPSIRERRVIVVDRKGSVQSEIRIGHVGVERRHPDVFALTVLNTLLGGAFTSRLNLNLRERNGFTYGVRSRFVLPSQPGSFEVSTAVGSEVTAPAVAEILGELERLVDAGPTDQEVVSSRDYIAGVFPLRMETVGQIAARISDLVVYGLEDEYHRTYRDRIRAVTREQATEAGRRHIRPTEAQVVVVGNADSVVSPLEALGLGPLEVVRTRA
jgi:zinc protease